LNTTVRRFAFVALLLMVAGISVLGTLFWAWTRDMAKPDPPILSDLAGRGSSEQNVSYQHRLRQRFPIGSAEADLADGLRREGFVQIDWGGATGTLHQAEWKREGLPCATGAQVRWTADDRGRITGIDGLYGYACL
jgi:hypothetical protein